MQRGQQEHTWRTMAWMCSLVLWCAREDVVPLIIRHTTTRLCEAPRQHQLLIFRLSNNHPRGTCSGDETECMPAVHSAFTKSSQLLQSVSVSTIHRRQEKQSTVHQSHPGNSPLLSSISNRSFSPTTASRSYADNYE